jgi:hypothetical protein
VWDGKNANAREKGNVKHGSVIEPTGIFSSFRCRLAFDASTWRLLIDCAFFREHFSFNNEEKCLKIAEDDSQK